MNAVPEGTLLWEPSADLAAASNLAAYMGWLRERRGLVFEDYDALWRWSVTDVSAFWASIWEYFQVEADGPYREVLTGRRGWFDGTRLNYARHALRGGEDDRPAVVHCTERGGLSAITRGELRDRTARVAAALRAMGVGRGDRVAAYMPNIPETAIAFLACASLGATWSCCSPDFGAAGTIDRFRQIEPTLLFAVDGYRYGGRRFDRRDVVEQIRAQLPTLQHTVFVSHLDEDGGDDRPAGTRPWAELLTGEGDLEFADVPFDHPLWILYSSGTTGPPKAIVHGHGGILLEHLKTLHLQFDLTPGDRFLWFTTSGWMMWNLLIGAALVGAVPVLYEGSPAWPDLDALWALADESEAAFFGTSAGYIIACAKAGLEPRRRHAFRALKGIGSTGAPLPPEGFGWVYASVKRDVWLASYSGGTDVCSGFAGACVLRPVHAGEIQAACLGVRVEAYDEAGRSLVGEVGELVVTTPMPSMPIRFWNDPGDARYEEAYFSTYPGVWHHGDWVIVKPHGSLVIYGRSDATINRHGVRMGTSEIYAAVEAVPSVADSLVVDLEGLGGASYMPLFVVLAPGAELDDELVAQIKAVIRTALSPRHVPDDVFAVAEVPRTLSGKKLEVPVKRVLAGTPAEVAANPASIRHPGALEAFEELAALMPRG